MESTHSESLVNGTNASAVKTPFDTLVDAYLQTQKDSFQVSDEKTSFEDHLVINDEEAKHTLLGINEQYRKGKIND